MLNQYIQPQPFQNGDSDICSSVDTSQWLGCLHRPNWSISSHLNLSADEEIPSFHIRQSGIPAEGTTFWTVPKSVDFHQAGGRYCYSPSSTFHLTLSLPIRLAHIRSSKLQTNFSDNILSSNYASSRAHSKSKKSQIWSQLRNSPL